MGPALVPLFAGLYPGFGIAATSGALPPHRWRFSLRAPI